MKLLIVDDDSFVLNGLKSMIAWENLGVDKVYLSLDGEEGLKQFNTVKPDLVLTDVFMPKMDGLELIKRIRKVDKDLPIVILSGYDEFDYAKEAVTLNVKQYILKPAVPKEIENCLKLAIQEKRNSDMKNRYLNELKDQLNQNIPIIREQFLSDMITSGLNHKSLTEQRLEYLGIHQKILRGGLILTVVLHRDSPIELESDWHLYKFTVHNIIQEIINEKGGAYVTRFIEDQLPIIVYGQKEDSLQRAKYIADTLINFISTYLEININVGIGRWYKNPVQYPLSMKQSKEALKMVDYDGYQKVFSSDDMYDHSQDHWPIFPINQINILSRALLLADRKQVLKLWSEVDKMLFSEKNLSLPRLKLFSGNIINNLLISIMKADNSLFEENQLHLFLSEIEQASTKQHLSHRLAKGIERLLVMFEDESKLDKRDTYVKYVKKVVMEKYQENITFTQIAQDLHLTKNYLSSLFKRETGKTFSHYLTSYRISKAKELMDTNRYMIYEISEMVGYTDPAYFSRIFKQTTGISPTDYILGTKDKDVIKKNGVASK